MCVVIVAFSLSNFGRSRDFKLRKQLQITVPEDLDYAEIFDDVFAEFTTRAELLMVKTTNLGSLNRLTYEVVMKKAGTEKAFIDALRCRNGNLEISLRYQQNEMAEL